MLLLRGLLVAGLLTLYLWGLGFLSVFSFGARDEATRADAIVVLGAAQYDGRPSPVLKGRLDHAVALYRDSLAARMILTGGVGVGDTVSEAEVSRRYVIKQGVNPAAILIERGGLSSVASMRAVSDVMSANGLASAILVSDPFHMLRLRLMAAGMGIRARSSPTPLSPIDRGSPEEWRYILREALILPSLALGERILFFTDSEHHLR
jgi:uncharacterized SAM-binding protein YcdF (DUF218 family)